MTKNRDGPPLGQARGDPQVMIKARGDPNPGSYKRSRAPTKCAQSLTFNRLTFPEWERYGQLSMKNDQ